MRVTHRRRKQFLHLGVVELAFLTLIAIILIYLILGESAGGFVKSVADNQLKFAGAVPTPSLIGLAIAWRYVTR